MFFVLIILVLNYKKSGKQTFIFFLDLWIVYTYLQNNKKSAKVMEAKLHE